MDEFKNCCKLYAHKRFPGPIGMSVSILNIRPQATNDTQTLRQCVWDACMASAGRFIRFLDQLDRAGIEVHPRWSMQHGVAPMHTFHMEPLRYRAKGTETAPQALSEDMGWPWLMCHLDYPMEAKERLLEMARPAALAWIRKQAPGKESQGEKRVREALEFLFGHPFPKNRPSWLVEPGYVHPCELDGHNDGLGLAFEFQGPQHYEAMAKYGMDKQALLQRQRTDAWKRLAVHDHGVFLLDVAHDELPQDKSTQALALVLLEKLNADGTGREYLAKLCDQAKHLAQGFKAPEYA